MNINLCFFSVCLLAGLMTGCGQSNAPEARPPPNDANSLSVTQQLENAREMVTNAWQNAKIEATNVLASMGKSTTNAEAYFKESLRPVTDYTFDGKEDFVADANTDVGAMDQNIAKLSERIANSAASVKTNAVDRLQELYARRAELTKKLEDVKDSSQTDWNKAKAGFIEAYNEVKASLQQMWQWVVNTPNS